MGLLSHGQGDPGVQSQITSRIRCIEGLEISASELTNVGF